jgi:hypothetical protein
MAFDNNDLHEDDVPVVTDMSSSGTDWSSYQYTPTDPASGVIYTSTTREYPPNVYTPAMDVEVVETVEEWEEERDGVTVTVRKKVTKTTHTTPKAAPLPQEPTPDGWWQQPTQPQWTYTQGINTCDSKTENTLNVVASD